MRKSILFLLLLSSVMMLKAQNNDEFKPPKFFGEASFGLGYRVAPLPGGLPPQLISHLRKIKTGTNYDFGLTI